MQRNGKLTIKYTFDENYNVLSSGVFPANRNSSVVEITNALTASLVIELSRNLGLTQSEVAQAIVQAVKKLVKKDANVRNSQECQDQPD